MNYLDIRIGRFLRGELEEDEERAFLTWLSKKAENRHYFEETKMIWEQATKTRSPFSPNVENAWEQFLDKVKERPRQNYYPHLYRWIAGTAASILIMVTLLYLFIFNEAPVKIVTQHERQFNIELPDGSLAWLNRDSEITFKESKSSRHVFLTGEAYFEVNPDSRRPFTIHTGELTTQVVGTSFNVDAAGKEFINVVVLSGKVLLFNNSKDSLFLTEGEIGSFDLSSKNLTEKQNTDPNFLAWKTGILIFDDTPMEQVIGVLTEHFDVNLEWDESTTSRLTATFDNQPLEEIISLIILSTEAEIRITETINEIN